jgi:hypothetical protein
VSEERVLLVADGEDVDSMNQERGLNIDWGMFRRVVPNACSILTKRHHPLNSEFAVPVEEVLEAHYFSTVWPPIHEEPQEHLIQWRRRYKHFEERGFIPQLSQPLPSADGDYWVSHSRRQVKVFIEAVKFNFDTLILLGDPLFYTQTAQSFARDRWRSFLIGKSDDRGSIIGPGVSQIDITCLQNFYTQTIRVPRPRRAARPLLLSA